MPPSHELINENGLLEQAPIQYVASAKTIGFKDSPDNIIQPGKFAIGKFLVSDGFGPCQAVVAKLKNGEFGVFHVTIPNSESAIQFARACEDAGGATKLWIFSKTGNARNLLKAPALAVYLSTEFLPRFGITAEVLQLNNYGAIICDSQSKTIVLSNTISYEQEASRFELAASHGDALPVKVDIATSQTIETSIEKLLLQHAEGFFRDANPNKLLKQLNLGNFETDEAVHKFIIDLHAKINDYLDIKKDIKPEEKYMADNLLRNLKETDSLLKSGDITYDQAQHGIIENLNYARNATDINKNFIFDSKIIRIIENSQKEFKQSELPLTPRHRN